MNKNILVIDDEKKMALLVSAALEDEGYSPVCAHTAEEGLHLFKKDPFFLVITDLKLPKASGLDVLREVKTQNPAAEVILMTAFASAATAVQAMKDGAYEYVIKPFEMDELLLKVKHIADRQKLNEENAELKKKITRSASYEDIIGPSKVMQNVFTLIDKVAERDVTVLIRGESGTGKEMVARAVHNRSARKTEPFVVVNCGALPENLLESELFGYEKGAFTGAAAKKQGHFEAAGSGTIFLDEIGDISPAIQVKLLRVLEGKQITHLGGTSVIDVPARVLAATNKDLEEAISAGEFREDLYYRLNVFPIHLPPLRDRREDIPPLVEHLLDGHAIDPKALEPLLQHRWTGNVRELANVLERARILAGDAPVTMDNLPPSVLRQHTARFALEIPEEGIVLEEVEKDLIFQALDKARGNKTKAARLLGITRRTLYSKLEKYS